MKNQKWDPEFERYIESKMKNYFESYPPSDGKDHPIYVITISRQPGCDARHVARLVAQKLWLNSIGSEIIGEILRCMEFPFPANYMGVVPGYESSNRPKEQILELAQFRELYLQLLRRTMLALIEKRCSVFIGRGANHVLGKSVHLRVRLIASRETRLRHLFQEHQLKEREADEVLRIISANRSAYHHYFFGADDDDPQHYDLVCNLDLGRDKAVDSIISETKERRGKGQSGTA